MLMLKKNDFLCSAPEGKSYPTDKTVQLCLEAVSRTPDHARSWKMRKRPMRSRPMRSRIFGRCEAGRCEGKRFHINAGNKIFKRVYKVSPKGGRGSRLAEWFRPPCTEQDTKTSCQLRSISRKSAHRAWKNARAHQLENKSSTAGPGGKPTRSRHR